MLNDRHLCSSVLCSQKDSCGSQVVHDGQFGDGCHHYLWQTPQQSVPPGGGSKSFNVSGTTNCRQWLPPPAFPPAFIMLCISPAQTCINKKSWWNQSEMQFLLVADPSQIKADIQRVRYNSKQAKPETINNTVFHFLIMGPVIFTAMWANSHS